METAAPEHLRMETVIRGLRQTARADLQMETAAPELRRMETEALVKAARLLKNLMTQEIINMKKNCEETIISSQFFYDKHIGSLDLYLRNGSFR